MGEIGWVAAAGGVGADPGDGKPLIAVLAHNAVSLLVVPLLLAVADVAGVEGAPDGAVARLGEEEGDLLAVARELVKVGLAVAERGGRYFDHAAFRPDLVILPQPQDGERAPRRNGNDEHQQRPNSPHFPRSEHPLLLIWLLFVHPATALPCRAGGNRTAGGFQILLGGLGLEDPAAIPRDGDPLRQHLGSDGPRVVGDHHPSGCLVHGNRGDPMLRFERPGNSGHATGTGYSFSLQDCHPVSRRAQPDGEGKNRHQENGDDDQQRIDKISFSHFQLPVSRPGNYFSYIQTPYQKTEIALWL